MQYVQVGSKILKNWHSLITLENRLRVMLFDFSSCDDFLAEVFYRVGVTVISDFWNSFHVMSLFVLSVQRSECWDSLAQLNCSWHAALFCLKQPSVTGAEGSWVYYWLYWTINTQQDGSIVFMLFTPNSNCTWMFARITNCSLSFLFELTGYGTRCGLLQLPITIYYGMSFSGPWTPGKNSSC